MLHRIISSRPATMIAPGWTQIQSPNPRHQAAARKNNVFALASLDLSEIGNVEWLHVSFSRRNMVKISFRDLMRWKNEWFGEETEAIQVFPKVSEMVDMGNIYHLWAPVGRN
ncbi:DUF7694 domain-containing protein [Desulfovibrio inopinatus]|uniref:DUF7694 domain-containing protein n=1 Tax=Desulfovibrio inopinatus TaxID=102109 RepID=UPI0004848AB8|nr:hypothetical protein [Desulfovibrio inopinatus]